MCTKRVVKRRAGGTSRQRIAERAKKRKNCYLQKVHLAPVSRRYNGVFYSWSHAKTKSLASLRISSPPWKDHDSSPVRERTLSLLMTKGVMGDVIDREVPFPLSSRHFGGMRSSRRSLSSAKHPSQETTLCPLSSSARAAAGTHRRWATSTRAVSGLGVETRDT